MDIIRNCENLHQMRISCIQGFILFNAIKLVIAFAPPSNTCAHSTLTRTKNNDSNQSNFGSGKIHCKMVFGFGAGSASDASIPSSPAARDTQAINAIKSSIKSPRDFSMPLIECEFPALQALNKLGDGSLRSVLEVEDVSANESYLKVLHE